MRDLFWYLEKYTLSCLRGIYNITRLNHHTLHISNLDKINMCQEISKLDLMSHRYGCILFTGDKKMIAWMIKPLIDIVC